MAQQVKKLPGFDRWLGRSPGDGKGYPLQYSGLENSMDCIVHGIRKSLIQLSDFHFYYFKMSVYLAKRNLLCTLIHSVSL